MNALAHRLRARIPAHWAEFRPWQTNLALILLGFGMIHFMQQLITEADHFEIGFSGVSSSALVLYVAAITIFLLKPSNTDRYTLPIILFFAIVCRLVALFPGAFLSTDVYRYAWDGMVQHEHINPYRYVPGDSALAFLRDDNQDLYDHINRRDYAHTIYPPVAQMAFYLIAWISPGVTAMKTAMVAFEGLTMVALVKLLRHLGMTREWTLLYAWFPLVMWEFGSSGHLDSMVMALLMLAVLFRFERRPVLTGLFLGLAVFTKFYPLAVFPALYRRGDWKMPATLASVGLLCYLPYLSAGKMVFGFLGGYAKEEGLNNGSRYFLLDLVHHVPGLAGVPDAAFNVFLIAVLGSLCLWAWRTSCRDQSPPAAFLRPALALGFATMLLFSPHYPWYVAWLLPFFVLMPSLTLLVYLGGIFYMCTTRWAVGYGPEQYFLNKCLYSVVAVTAIIEFVLRRNRRTGAWFRSLTPVLTAATERFRP